MARRLKKTSEGFTIVELIVALVIFVAVIGSFFGGGQLALRAVSKASDKTQAAFLLEEGLDGVRYLRDISWKTFIDTRPLGYEECLSFDSTTKAYVFTAPDIVSQWHLDEPTTLANGGAIADATGKNNGGTFTINGAGGMTTSGKYFHAASIVDSNDYIVTTMCAGAGGGCSSNLALGPQISIEAWVKPNATGATQHIIKSSAPTTNQGGLDLVAGVPRVVMPVNGCTSDIDSLPAQNSISASWHHIVGTYDASSRTMQIYVDGQLESSKQNTCGDGSLDWRKPFYIGALQGSITNIFDGMIDEVEIYGRVLSAREVLDRSGGKAVCTPLVDQKFNRSITFLNTCRNNSGQGAGTYDDIASFTTGGTCPVGQYEDNANNSGTKKGTIIVRWQDYSETLDFYIADLFRQ